MLESLDAVYIDFTVPQQQVARVPVGVQRLGAYCLRFQIQTLGYVLLVTDRYPTLANEFSARR